MALFTHVASRPHDLVGELCDQISHPLDDLFATEVIAVPTRGIERWLTQTLASEFAERGQGDGICANIEFPFPSRLIRQALLQVPGLQASIVGWEGVTLQGHILDAVDVSLEQPWMSLLARYLEQDDPRLGSVSPNRLSAAQKIARLFTTYSRRRPDMIRAWIARSDVGSGGNPLAEEDLWQPRLWRVVRGLIDLPSLPELLPAALEPVRRGEVQLGLPERIAVYGLTATDPVDLEVLVALSARTDVHLYVLHPSPGLWVANRAAPGPVPSRDDDTSEALCIHPLVKAWGRDSRELQTVLAAHQLGATPVDRTDEDPRSLLARIQADIRHNRAPGSGDELDRQPEQEADHSVQIHRCHGSRRQAEVLRDALLHALTADPTLEPRDIVIMTPDLETFAPLLEAAFPARSPQLPDLRLRIADRSPAVTNPLVRFTANLLALADGRLEAGVIRELVAQPVVQNRFGFDTETAGQIRKIIDDANVSWGLDADHREQWSAGPNNEGTWSRGLDRALAGVFYSDSAVRVTADTVPLDGVEGQEGIPVGVLSQIIDRLRSIRALLSAPMRMSAWAGAISSSVRLLGAPAWGDEWQWDQLERLLADTFPDIEDDLSNDPSRILGLGDARAATARWTEDRPSPLHFRTGNVTLCTLAPMRSVPYRVVCLLGLDDQRFPRSGRTDGDDLLLRHEFVGDHDGSAEDRQLLLDAIMAAEQQLIITYSGRDELTNAELPPAVPLAELEDTLEDMVGAQGLDEVVTVHPLQAFSEENFTPGSLGVPGPWGFDAMQLDGAKAIQGHRRSPSTPAAWSNSPQSDQVELADLISFLQHPAKEFVRSRLGFTIPKLGDLPDDTLPADLNALARWGVKDRLLNGLEQGVDLPSLAERERASDALPPQDLGSDDIEQALEDVELLWDAATDRGHTPWDRLPVAGAVPVGDFTVVGSVLVDPGPAKLVTVTASRLKGKQRLDTFTRLVFVTALAPDTAWTGLLLGRGRGDTHLAVTMGPLGEEPTDREETAVSILTELLDLYREGHDAPLPMPCETSYEWQRMLGQGRNKAFGGAVAKWEKDRFSPEAQDFVHEMVFPSASTGDMVDRGLDSYSDRLWSRILLHCREQKL